MKQCIHVSVITILFIAASVPATGQGMELDVTFNAEDTSTIGYGTSGEVHVITQIPDGRVLIGGLFEYYNDQRVSRITGVLPNGAIDTSLHLGTGANDYVWAITGLGDGKIMVGGAFNLFNDVPAVRIVRLLANGEVDTTFQSGTGANDGVHRVVEQPDGRLIIVGSFTDYNGVPRRKLARLEPDGALDLSFDPGTGCDQNIQDVLLLNDGRILIAGDFQNYNGTPCGRIARLLPDGALDTTFQSGTGAGNSIWRMALDDQGRILIGGIFLQYNGISRSRIARLLASGELDTTFDPGTGADQDVNSILITTDGKLLVGGDFEEFRGSTRDHLVRLLPNGQVDNTFSSNAQFKLIEYQSFTRVSPMLMLQDSSILVGGRFRQVGTLARDNIVKLVPNGDPLASFNDAKGLAYSNPVPRMHVDNSGRILVSHRTLPGYNGTATVQAIRLEEDGQLDPTFLPPTGFQLLATLGDGTGLVAKRSVGAAEGEFRRVTTLGAAFPSFISSSFYGGLESALQLADGRILIAGWFDDLNNTNVSDLALLLPNGLRDNSFSPGSFQPSQYEGDKHVLIQQPDGKILLGGDFQSYDGHTTHDVVRINLDGSVDEGFSALSYLSSVWAMHLNANGTILIAGEMGWIDGDPALRICRLLADGTLDPSFDPGTGPNNYVYSMVVMPDERILLGGTFTEYDGRPVESIVCLLPDGSLDTTFTIPSITSSIYYDQVRDMALTADGGLIIVGNFTHINGLPRHRIARFRLDSSTGTPTLAQRRAPPTLWPNPTDGLLRIELPQASSVEVCDVSGRVVMAPPTAQASSLTLDLGHLRPGPYIVRGTDASGQRWAGHVVVY